MKLMSAAIIYLVLMLDLGAGAVVNVEQKLTEEMNIVVRRVLEEMIENLQTDRISENNLADIITQNKQLTTGESEHGDVKRGLTMSCVWQSNRGRCCHHLSNIGNLCIQLSVSGSGMFVEVSRNRFTFGQRFIRGTGAITFTHTFGYLHLKVTVSVVRTNVNIRTCLQIKYNVGFRHYAANLGCNNKRWHSNENHSVTNLSPNIKNPVGLQGFDNQPYNDGYLDLISDRIALAEEIVQEVRSDRTVVNNVVNYHKENSATKGSKIRDVQLRRLKCTWQNKNGNCSVLLENLPWLYVNMTVVPTGIHFLLQIGSLRISDFCIYGDRTKVLNRTMGPAQIWFQISVRNNTSHYVKVCVFLKYKVDFWRWSGSLGCPSRSFPTRKESNTPITTTKALNKNFQQPVKFQNFDPVMGFRVIENQIENSVILNDGVVKQNEK